MPNPLLANLDSLDGPALKARFHEARKAAVAAGAVIDAYAATRAMQTVMRNAIRSMASGIDAHSTDTGAEAGAPVPAPMRPVAPPRPPVLATAIREESPAPKPQRPPVMSVGPPIDPADDWIPF
ncbi:hypothetical protein [Methylobacterium sp. SD21]|uniref:hypothetical protein n=1 Tax=Methylobacterium litchii TaxID=3138810 RepID=UPI00313DFD6F